MNQYILVIDEGTTSTRAIAFDRELKAVQSSQIEIPLTYPHSGWVEQDAEAIWSHTLEVCRNVIAACGGAAHFAAIGIANQRETTLLWDRKSGEAFGTAIIWQDRRTADYCNGLKPGGNEARLQAISGLLLDPYFSASKLRWILENRPDAAAAAAKGEAAFGTVDSYLLARLTGGETHATDVTNASRTALMNLATHEWSDELTNLFDIPGDLLPNILPTGGTFGMTSPELFGKSLPVLSMVGDQQAALIGQACVQPGEAKITYGTGAFLVANTGGEIPVSQNRLLATCGYKAQGQTHWALEGSIFNAGTVIKWLRDELGLINQAADTEAMAKGLNENGGVYFVPAFTGLGAPHWAPDARGQITGLTRGTSAAHIVRAGLESAVYQTRDLLKAFESDGCSVDILRVDGGMAANDWLLQFLADITGLAVERPVYPEMTALGAAVIAAGELGWMSLKDWHEARQVDRRFEPAMSDQERERLLSGWEDALARTISD